MTMPTGIMKYINRLSVLLLTGGFFSGCSNELEEIKAYNAQSDSLSVERASEVKITYTDSARIKAIIRTPLLERYPQKENPYLEMPKGLTATFYDERQQMNSSLRADYAISYDKTKIITVRRNVRVRNIREEELETEELHWNQKDKKIYTDQFVKIRRKDEILYGRGFESNETFTRYRIRQPEGKFTIPESEANRP